MRSLAPALFLDRDGVVNREVEYLYQPEQVQFTPGIFDLCRAAQALRYKLIIISNQAGIARQFYSEDEFHSLMRWMTAEFFSQGIELDGYYFCPHHPEYGTGRYRRDCPDRKPQPGMLVRAAREKKINLSRSLFLGDRCTDMKAGAAAGVGTLVLLQGTETAPCDLTAFYNVVPTVTEVIGLLAGTNVSI